MTTSPTTFPAPICPRRKTRHLKRSGPTSQAHEKIPLSGVLQLFCFRHRAYADVASERTSTMDVSNDKVVNIDYMLTGQDGKVIDSSEGRGPRAYLHGKSNIIPGL